ncbi:hypothetical protein B7494_g7711 [Chlorociboria aeruginascens]|nr:hypothetical protein B7494_g7711 [Chlorociboria aeruginascens]
MNRDNGKAPAEMSAGRDGVYNDMPPDSSAVDIEQKASIASYLMNTTISSFAWKGVTVTVKDHKTKLPKAILENAEGIVRAGELCALMGPSGSGKSTLLDVLAHRDAASGVKIEGTTLVNGNNPTISNLRRISSTLNKTERIVRIEQLIDSFGLKNQANTIIGTPIRKGISGGQKRRLSAASQLITDPKILFLDEPTSGLDSAASFEVISYVKEVAKRNNLIIIASIHQPSTSTFQLFDKLLLLSSGKPHYFGPVSKVGSHFESIHLPIPLHTNPAEFLLDLMNVDFALDQSTAYNRLSNIQQGWASSFLADAISEQIERVMTRPEALPHSEPSRKGFVIVLMTLVHRAFVKSYRDVVAYGIRVAMYTGLSIMMGTVWVRLKTDQSNIQPFINAIFFGSAFMSFMAVAYVPSFLEDRATFIKERANGLYGSAVFMLSNFIIGLPYLSYFLSNFRPTATAFFTWIMWLFLDLVAAESLVVLISSLFPSFVISLALIAFANGLWMSVGGFLVSPKVLNVFWRYVFHYIDYQVLSPNSHSGGLD